MEIVVVVVVVVVDIVAVVVDIVAVVVDIVVVVVVAGLVADLVAAVEHRLRQQIPVRTCAGPASRSFCTDQAWRTSFPEVKVDSRSRRRERR